MTTDPYPMPWDSHPDRRRHLIAVPSLTTATTNTTDADAEHVAVRPALSVIRD